MLILAKVCTLYLQISSILAITRFYDTFTGTTVSLDRVRETVRDNNTFWCVIEVEDCDPSQGRRLDGTCNNPKCPTRGGTKTPFKRVLPAVYSQGFEPRKAECGEDLPLARKVSMALLGMGQRPDPRFTTLMTHYWVFSTSDVAALHDTVNYIQWTPHCCTPKGDNDYMCTPNKIPDDDPVFRFSDIRCLNMTRPISFQTSRCLPNNTVPERINSATPLHDLSNIYGSVLNSSVKARTYEGGLLKEEKEGGRVWPPSYLPGTDRGVCRLNQANEKRCHQTPDDSSNSLAGINLLVTWFWRQHNRIARRLAKLNPCWDDDKLFSTARDINIAIYNQIYYYEMLPCMLGRDNMVQDNVISSTLSFRDFYDEHSCPQVSLEYPYVLRWVHTVQDGRLKMYDTNGHYLKQFPYVNLTLRTGFFAVDNNIDYITQGSFRQPSANFDYMVDPDLKGIALGPHQRAADLTTNDLAKGRYFGFPSYIKYREYCSGRPVTAFDDLIDVIDTEKIDQLKELYVDVSDIDMLAGVWLENYVRGGVVPPTLYCLVVDQLLRNIVTDRHWYERPNRPNAFTYPQLQEIRKATIAGVMCGVADTVTYIQPRAFLRQGPGNEFRSCELIEKINLRAWYDPTCNI